MNANVHAVYCPLPNIESISLKAPRALTDHWYVGSNVLGVY